MVANDSRPISSQQFFQQVVDLFAWLFARHLPNDHRTEDIARIELRLKLLEEGALREYCAMWGLVSSPEGCDNSAL